MALYPLPTNVKAIFRGWRATQKRYYPPVDHGGRWRCVFCGCMVNQTSGRCKRTTWTDEGWIHE